MSFSEVMEDKILEDQDRYKDIVGREDDDKNNGNKNPEGYENIDASGKETNDNIDPKKAEGAIQILSNREDNDIFYGDEKLDKILEGNLDSPLLTDAQKESFRKSLAYSNGNYSIGLEEDSNENNKNNKKNIETPNNMA